MTDQELLDAIDALVDAGVLSRWWCEVCADYVPYRTLEMTERQSRRLHGKQHRKISADRTRGGQ